MRNILLVSLKLLVVTTSVTSKETVSLKLDNRI